jgi:dipeptidyl aminopeptidase/acylaminoacyl peptidase
VDWIVVGMPLLLAAGCLLAGCSREARQPAGAITALTTGYDPAWSPDGSRIAYVESSYSTRGRQGLWLSNDGNLPAKRQAICLWDLAADSREVLGPDEAGDSGRGKVIISLVWRNNDELVYLATDVTDADQRMSGFKGKWDWLPIYRDAALTKDLYSINLLGRKSDLPTCVLPAPITGLEPGRGSTGEIICWQSRRSAATKERVRFSMTLDNAGRLVPGVTLPSAKWTGPPEATMRTLVPVIARRGHGRKSYLSRLRGDKYEDFYSADGLIVGVYGSPDGRRVAFEEESRGYVPIARMRLKVMEISGAAPVVIAEDAWPWSHVAWSPDGTKIAYARAEDGRIVIAKVPPLSH